MVQMSAVGANGRQLFVGNRGFIAIVIAFVVLATARRPNLWTDDSQYSLTVSSTPTGKSPVIFTSSARACPRVEAKDENLKSQYGEDRKLLEWFGGLCDGTYLEMGALDGVTFSNTHVFNKEFGWRGVLVELAAQNFELLVQNRPNEIANIHAGVCGERRILHYVEGRHAVGGIWEFAPESFKNQWWSGLTLESPEVHPVECAPLADLLKPHVGESFFFDLFSLDVEGAEFEVLKSIDFSKIGFGIIMAEADTHNQLKNMALRLFLESKGYKFIMEQTNSYWFFNSAFAQIYGDKLRVDPSS